LDSPEVCACARASCIHFPVGGASEHTRARPGTSILTLYLMGKVPAKRGERRKVKGKKEKKKKSMQSTRKIDDLMVPRSRLDIL